MPPEAADRTTRTPPRRSLHEFENVCSETDIRMKRLVALWLCATVWLSAGGQSRDWANTGRYAAANAALAVRPKVVFIGDSITEGWYSAHPSFFDANGFAARGISGQVTAQMLARFQCDVVALRPRAVVILAGTNDIARTTVRSTRSGSPTISARWPNWRGRTGCGSSSVRCFRRRVTAGAPK